MIKNSFKTVFKSPVLLLGHFLPILVYAICYIPFFTGTMQDNSPASIMFMMLSMLLIFVLGLALQFVYLPALYSYTYERATFDSVEKGWFKRGLKRNWWKVFVTTLIAAIPFYIVYFVFFFAIFASVYAYSEFNTFLPMIIGVVLFTLFAIVWQAFMIISIVSVVAEEQFETGFKNIFKIGIKDLFRVTLAYILLALPPIIVVALVALMDYAYTATQFFVALDATPVIIVVLMILFYIVAATIFVPFLFVYTNKLYAKRKQTLMPKNTNTDMQEQNL